MVGVDMNKMLNRQDLLDYDQISYVTLESENRYCINPVNPVNPVHTPLTLPDFADHRAFTLQAQLAAACRAALIKKSGGIEFDAIRHHSRAIMLLRFVQFVQCFFARGLLGLALNDGPAASQTVPHVHLHLIPRTRRDIGVLLGKLLARPVQPLLGAAPRAILDQQASAIRAALPA
jgi:diadenosine tetraphosphate (Ap4A) HIT family hydrolase